MHQEKASTPAATSSTMSASRQAPTGRNKVSRKRHTSAELAPSANKKGRTADTRGAKASVSAEPVAVEAADIRAVAKLVEQVRHGTLTKSEVADIATCLMVCGRKLWLPASLQRALGSTLVSNHRSIDIAG